MAQEAGKPLTIERTTTLELPAGLVEKLILEAIGAPRGATITSAEEDNYNNATYLPLQGVRVTWTSTEPSSPLSHAELMNRHGKPEENTDAR